MYIEAVALLGLLAGSCEGQRAFLRRGPPYGSSNSTIPGTSKAISSSSSSSSSPSSSGPSSSSPSPSSSSSSILSSSLVPYSSVPSVYTTPSSAPGSAANSSSQPSVPATSSIGHSTSPYSSQTYTYQPSSGGLGTAPSYSSKPPYYSLSSAGTGSASYHSKPIIPTGTGPGSKPYHSKSVIPTGTGPTGHNPNGTVPTQGAHNPQCSGQTLNVLGASLDWWYTRTLYNVVSTISVYYDKNASQNVWTAIPATTPFDLVSALATPTCITSYTYNSLYNETLAVSSCTPAPTPVAADTTVLSQTAYKALNATTGYGNPPDVISTPALATITIPDDGGYAEGTAFVFFSQYEIMTKSHTTFGNGSAGCATATQTYTMDEPFSFEYSDGDVNGSLAVGAGVTGDVNPAFLGVVDASAKAGSWVAAPTVALVVQDVVVEHNVFTALVRPGFAPRVTTETVLQTPEPTLPTFNTPTPPPKTPVKPPPTKPNGQKTDTKLQVPTKGSGPGPGNTQKPKPPKNSPTPPKNPPNPGKPGGKPTTNALSVLKSAEATFKNHNGNGPGNGPGGGRPPTTNALSVLESAEKTFTHTNPTAGAIINGIRPGHHTDGPQGPGGGNPGGGNPGGGNPGSGNPGGGNPGGLGPVSPGEKNGVGSGPNGHPIVVVGGTTFTGNSHTHFVLGPGETLVPGGVAHIHGHSVSLASGATAIIVDGHTQTAAQAIITPAPIIVGGTAFSPNSGTTYHIGGQALTPGGVITVDGTTISLLPGATAVVVNGVTQVLGNGPNPTAPPVLTIGGNTFTAINHAGTFVIDGKTLVPGGVIIVDGTTVSLASPATAVVINGVTQNLASPTSPPVLTIGGNTYTAINGGATYVINGKTLVPGGVIVVDGTTISLAPGATAVVVDGHTQSLTGVAAASITAPPVLSIGRETFTAINGGYTYNINGETLTPGEEETVTVDGKTYIVSLYPGATVLKIETEGPNGQVTATTYETLFAAGGASATAGSKPGAGPSASGTPVLSNMASSTTLHFSGICFAFGTFALAVWL